MLTVEWSNIMKNALFISGNIFAACGLLLIGIGITAFQSLTSLYKYLSHFTTVDLQAQISLNTVLIIGGAMIVVGIVQILIACLRKEKYN